jgi:hypothetical protein
MPAVVKWTTRPERGRLTKGIGGRSYVAKQSTELELLVAKIQKDLAPSAEVVHNIYLPGRNSETKRQIDVLVRQKVGQYVIQIVIDCKDYNKPVDVKGVEEFAGLVHDVGAQKGVLVCPKGFTKAAKNSAQKLQIDLYSPVDTDPHKWQARATIPTVCDFRGAKISFGVKINSPAPWTLPQNFFDVTKIYNSDGNLLGTAKAQAMKKWNSGGFPTDVGIHGNLPIFDSMEVFADIAEGPHIEIVCFANLLVQRTLFYHQFPIERMTGFKDEISGGVITNAFETGMLDLDEVERSWKRIGDISEAPISPVLILHAMHSW